MEEKHGEPVKVDGTAEVKEPSERQDFNTNKRISLKHKLSKLKSKFKLICILLIILSASISGLVFYLNNTGLKGSVKKTMKCYQNYDIAGLLLLSSNVYFHSEDDKYFENHYKELVGEAIDDYEDSFGHDYKFNYDITDVYVVSNRQKEKIGESVLKITPDYDVSKLADIKLVELVVTVSNGEESKTDKLKLTFSKEGKDWKLLFIEP